MRAPVFWWRKPGPAAALLAPLGAIYGAVAAARLRRAGARASVPVICIGDPTFGGAGKTPTAIAIAALLAGMGERPFILSRGYGGRESGPLIVDPVKHDASAVGDEALLSARAAPTIIAVDRVAAAALAAGKGASVIVMDDGFQNASLAKNLALLVVDAASGVGDGLTFPAGPLRAPLKTQFKRAHGLVLVGGGAAGLKVVERAAAQSLPILAARLAAGPEAADLKGKKVLAFAGIGRPEKFFATLEGVGAEVAIKRAFADHHRYSSEQAKRLIQEAKQRDLVLITTEKDQVRMAHDPALAELYRAARALPVKLIFFDEAAVKKLLAGALARARG
jgi:tetraacyldisaccharide 4'-kinase